MASCAHCGLYFPASEAVSADGRDYCCPAHVRQPPPLSADDARAGAFQGVARDLLALAADAQRHADRDRARAAAVPGLRRARPCGQHRCLRRDLHGVPAAGAAFAAVTAVLAAPLPGAARLPGRGRHRRHLAAVPGRRRHPQRPRRSSTCSRWPARPSWRRWCWRCSRHRWRRCSCWPRACTWQFSARRRSAADAGRHDRRGFLRGGAAGQPAGGEADRAGRAGGAARRRPQDPAGDQPDRDRRRRRRHPGGRARRPRLHRQPGRARDAGAGWGRGRLQARRSAGARTGGPGVSRPGCRRRAGDGERLRDRQAVERGGHRQLARAPRPGRRT